MNAVIRWKNPVRQRIFQFMRILTAFLHWCAALSCTSSYLARSTGSMEWKTTWTSTSYSCSDIRGGAYLHRRPAPSRERKRMLNRTAYIRSSCSAYPCAVRMLCDVCYPPTSAGAIWCWTDLCVLGAAVRILYIHQIFGHSAVLLLQVCLGYIRRGNCRHAVVRALTFCKRRTSWTILRWRIMEMACHHGIRVGRHASTACTTNSICVS